MRKNIISVLVGSVTFAALAICGPTLRAADTPPAPPTNQSASASAQQPLDEAKIIKKIKEFFICPNNGSTIAESEADGTSCPGGDYAIGVVKRIINGTVTESDIITIARQFPQGKSLLTDLGTPACAKEGKLQLEFFIMSYCPYGVRYVDGVLNAMANDLGDNLDWTPYYILDRDEKGKLTSMHGQTEVDEDLRGICIREKFGRSKWLSYMNCFSREIFSKRNAPDAKEWKYCAIQAEMNPDDIETCFKNEADKLAEKDMRLSATYSANGSPTAVYNCSKQIVGAIPYKDIKTQICKQIPGTKPDACKQGASAPSTAPSAAPAPAPAPTPAPAKKEPETKKQPDAKSKSKQKPTIKPNENN